MQLTVDSLRARCYEAHFFGLGFIQVKLDRGNRVHFYHPDLPAFVEEPHDHRYWFVSEVLRGVLRNYIYELDEGGDPVLVEYETCTADSEEEIPDPEEGGLVYLGQFDTAAGSGYYMPVDTFHRVKPLYEHGPCVTFLRRGDVVKQFARVIRTGEEPVCPFSRPIPDSKLWEMVEDCLRQ